MRSTDQPKLIRTAIIDDHPAVLLGTMAIIDEQPDMTVVSASESVQALLDKRLELDVVILDLVLPDIATPEENIRQLREYGVLTIVHTSGDNVELIRAAAKAGANGYVHKSTTAQLLVEAIRSVVAGDVAAASEWAAALATDIRFVSAGLTTREAEVLALYAAGATSRLVAQHLAIAPATVLDYIRRVRAKYVAVDRAAPSKIDLLRRAQEDGVVP